MCTEPYRARRGPLLGISVLLLVCALGLTLAVSSGELFGSATHSDASRRSVEDSSRRLVLTVEPNHPGHSFALGAVGLSIETDELETADLSVSHQRLVALLRLLGPGVLRLGGDSVDYSWWTGDNEPKPRWAKSVITPADLVDLRELLKATGWRAILGVDLGHFEPARAANEAHTATSILGESLLGIEIGNEPDDYGHGSGSTKLRPAGYNAAAYLSELNTYVTAIDAIAPGVQLYGPDLSSQTWLPAIAAAQGLPFAAITQHFYPTTYNNADSTCEETPVPTASQLLSQQVQDRENTELRNLISAGETAHRETRITETNTTGSCNTSGGPATSPVFASALWSLDWSLRAASAGVAGLNFHGYFGRCVPDGVNPICAPSNAAEARGQVIARPEYYGLLAARQLEGGDFIPVHIRGVTPAGITVYATIHTRGTITLAIDNVEATGSPTIVLRAATAVRATSERLLGPSLDATTGVTFGHASLNASGRLRPKPVPIPPQHGSFAFKVPSDSAVIVHLYQ